MYFATIYIAVENETSDLIENAFRFEVEDGDFFSSGKKVPTEQSKILVDFDLTYRNTQ